MKIALLGYGRMGQAIARLAEAKGHEILLKISEENQEALSGEALSMADVAIDFSLPESAERHIRMALDCGVPVVSGTTGWLDAMPEVRSYCQAKGGAFLYASNFSIGVNLFFRLNRYLAQLMESQPQYEVSMRETHHIHKVDSPSGTAISLAEQILQGLSRKRRWAETDSPDPEVLPIAAFREGEVTGTHSVHYRSDMDSIEIQHTAHSRDAFAAGALMAAEWLPGHKGCFDMGDVLGF